MLNLYKKNNCSIIATKKVKKENVSRWGILSVKNKLKRSFQITNVVEKPKISQAESNYAIIGRYILSTNIIKEIKNLKPGQGGEIHITDAIKNMILKKEKFLANIFTGKYLDCGTMEGYIKSGSVISKKNNL